MNIIKITMPISGIELEIKPLSMFLMQKIETAADIEFERGNPKPKPPIVKQVVSSTQTVEVEDETDADYVEALNDWNAKKSDFKHEKRFPILIRSIITPPDADIVAEIKSVYANATGEQLTGSDHDIWVKYHVLANDVDMIHLARHAQSLVTAEDIAKLAKSFRADG